MRSRRATSRNSARPAAEPTACSATSVTRPTISAFGVVMPMNLPTVGESAGLTWRAVSSTVALEPVTAATRPGASVDGRGAAEIGGESMRGPLVGPMGRYDEPTELCFPSDLTGRLKRHGLAAILKEP